jgi:hypothetical protein
MTETFYVRCARANYQNAYARFLKKTAAKTKSVGTTGVHLALD